MVLAFTLALSQTLCLWHAEPSHIFCLSPSLSASLCALLCAWNVMPPWHHPPLQPSYVYFHLPNFCSFLASVFRFYLHSTHKPPVSLLTSVAGCVTLYCKCWFAYWSPPASMKSETLAYSSVSLRQVFQSICPISSVPYLELCWEIFLSIYNSFDHWANFDLLLKIQLTMNSTVPLCYCAIFVLTFGPCTSFYCPDHIILYFFIQSSFYFSRLWAPWRQDPFSCFCPLTLAGCLIHAQ